MGKKRTMNRAATRKDIGAPLIYMTIRKKTLKVPGAPYPILVRCACKALVWITAENGFHSLSVHAPAATASSKNLSNTGHSRRAHRAEPKAFKGVAATSHHRFTTKDGP